MASVQKVVEEIILKPKADEFIECGVRTGYGLGMAQRRRKGRVESFDQKRTLDGSFLS